MKIPINIQFEDSWAWKRLKRKKLSIHGGKISLLSKTMMELIV
jgi:hypothetical protein